LGHTYLDGETGIHEGLKILWPEKGRAGSIPALGTSYCSLTYKEKQIMDTLSFISGIAFVVFIAIAVIAIYAFVKVKRIEKEIENVQRRIDHEVESLYRNISDNTDMVIRLIDSRCDKSVNKK